MTKKLRRFARKFETRQGQAGTVGAALFLALVPLFALMTGGVFLGLLQARYQKELNRLQSQELVQDELKRLVVLFNSRLNELREELLHLNGEQLSLARALSETERERLVFFRREHLAAFAVFVPSKKTPGEWELQKYFLRPNAQAGEKGTLATQALKNLASQMTGKSTGFLVRKVPGPLFGASWPGGDAFAAAFTSVDEARNPYLIAGVFRGSHVFSFCRFFADTLVTIPMAAFITDQDGRVFCHSQPRFEAANFESHAFFGQVRMASDQGTLLQYANAAGTSVHAMAKRIDAGPTKDDASSSYLFFIAEAAEGAWIAPIPYRIVGGVAGGILLISLMATYLLSSRLRGEFKGDAKTAAQDAQPEPPPLETPALAREPQASADSVEFARVRRELSELEITLLDMQSSAALVANFQKAVIECGKEQDVVAEAFKAVESALAERQPKLAWLELDKGILSLGRASGFESAGAELVEAECTDERLASLVEEKLRLKDFRVSWVGYGGKRFGAWAVAELGPALEVFPQLAEVMGAAIAAKRGA